MQNAQDLKTQLQAIDHRGYPAYKSLQGSYRFPGYILSIDHVQGDPFAAPSRVSIHLDGKEAGFPSGLYATRAERIALQDWLTRLFHQQTEQYNFKAKGSGKSGLLSVSRCGQEVLERTACTLNAADGSLVLRMQVGFPANGRTICAGELIRIFFEFLPDCVRDSLLYRRLDAGQLEQVRALTEDQEWLRQELKKRKLAAFVADGSILPRQSGVSEKPMKTAVPFASPESMALTLQLPNRGAVTGMAIPCGITLIVGGGFHGKSTLLKALERGVYNHIAGDGRELVITDATAVKLRAEDSRSIDNVDISLFINHLPGGRSTEHFSTEDASGSTSQAANVIEAIEAGTRLLLIDEDTSATNFMIRDGLMQQVVADEEEPITPFVARVRDLYEKAGISSILVAGSSGAYFHTADTVIQMKEYVPCEITARAKQLAAAAGGAVASAEAFRIPEFTRIPRAGAAFSGDRVKIKVLGREGILIHHSQTDLRYLEQISDPEQLSALAGMLLYAAEKRMTGRLTLTELVDQLEQRLEQEGLSVFTAGGVSDLARPRRQEIFACFNRCRDLNFREREAGSEKQDSGNRTEREKREREFGSYGTRKSVHSHPRRRGK